MNISRELKRLLVLVPPGDVEGLQAFVTGMDEPSPEVLASWLRLRPELRTVVGVMGRAFVELATLAGWEG